MEEHGFIRDKDKKRKLRELEKSPNKYFGGLTKGFDPKTNKPLFLAMTETGVVPVDGYQPYEEPKTPKKSLIKTTLGYEVVEEGELPKGKPVSTTQPRQPRLEKVTGTSGTYIVDMDTGETRPVLVDGKPLVAPPTVQPTSGEESNAAVFFLE